MQTVAALPRILRIGAGVSLDASAVLASLGLSRPLVVTDSFMVSNGLIEPMLAGMADQGLSPRVFSEAVPEPTVASIERGLAFLAEADHDCLLAFGGGSPIDSAKMLAVLARHGGRCADYKSPHVQDAAGLPIIAVPTTAGTGSEATRFTVITDDQTDEKMLCAGLAYLPTAALVDFELTLSMPARLTADTGIDSMTHAIEAFVSRRATPFSDIHALAAMRAIGPNLRRVFADPGDREAREAMMFGALQAGIAFSNASVALVHGMSRPIGAHFHVPHGLSNAMLLPAVTAYSAPAALQRYAACARALGFAAEDEGDQGAVGRLVDELARLNADLRVPGPRAYGIDPERWEALIPTMARQALASGSPTNNPLIPADLEIQSLYRQVWAAS